MLNNGVLNLKEVTRIYIHQSLNYRKKKKTLDKEGLSQIYIWKQLVENFQLSFLIKEMILKSWFSYH